MAEYSSKKRKQTTAPETVIAEAFLRGVWKVLSFPFRRKETQSRISPQVALSLAKHWPQIQQLGEEQTTAAHAVSEADKLLDAALQACGVPGTTIAERLKASSHLFSSTVYQAIWDAHKVRNTIAHEVGVVVTPPQAQQALHAFRSGLQQLGVPL